MGKCGKIKLIFTIVLKLFIQFSRSELPNLPILLALVPTEPVSREAHEAVPTQVLTSNTSNVGMDQNPVALLFTSK